MSKATPPTSTPPAADGPGPRERHRREAEAAAPPLQAL
jgi:hypothetical protein